MIKFNSYLNRFGHTSSLIEIIIALGINYYCLERMAEAYQLQDKLYFIHPLAGGLIIILFVYFKRRNKSKQTSKSQSEL